MERRSEKRLSIRAAMHRYAIGGKDEVRLHSKEWELSHSKRGNHRGIYRD